MSYARNLSAGNRGSEPLALPRYRRRRQEQSGELCHTADDGTHCGSSRENVRALNCKTFFARMGVSLDSPYFNAGVLLIDCNRWTASQTRLQLLEAAAKTGWNLPSGDQTLLNYHFQGRFDRLSPDWTCLAYAAAEPPSGSDRARIAHFIGRPKPWECGGWLNRQYPLYKKLADRHQLRASVPEFECWPDSAYRMARYVPSYIQCAARRVRFAEA